eukprot:GHUV01037892.1.p1 GENE.GHUV01037892.1~~GHUV01037892.1.p1  ORF type:complete len:161 (+),score=8.95 GHUV01037892.1:776-1258(+)
MRDPNWKHTLRVAALAHERAATTCGAHQRNGLTATAWGRHEHQQLLSCSHSGHDHVMSGIPRIPSIYTPFMKAWLSAIPRQKHAEQRSSRDIPFQPALSCQTYQASTFIPARQAARSANAPFSLTGSPWSVVQCEWQSPALLTHVPAAQNSPGVTSRSHP